MTKRSTSGPQTPAATAEPVLDEPVTARWQWRSFPVFVAFVSGVLIASVINGQPANPLAAVVQLLALFGVIYSLVHLFVTNVIVAGRAKRRREAIARGDTPEDDWEDEAMYPEQPPGR
jgi:hypothetical protein